MNHKKKKKGKKGEKKREKKTHAGTDIKYASNDALVHYRISILMHTISLTHATFQEAYECNFHLSENNN